MSWRRSSATPAPSSCRARGAQRGDLYDDAAAVREAIDAIDGPVTVVAHSYGGIVATEGAAGVEHIVYVAAFMLDVGESLYAAVGGQAPDWWELSDDGSLMHAVAPRGDLLQRLLARGHRRLRRAAATADPQELHRPADPHGVARERRPPT